MPAQTRQQHLPRSMVLIGPGRYFGAQLLRRFAAEGFEVGVVSRVEAHATELATVLQHDGIKLRWATADIRNPDSLRSALSALLQRLAPLNCLIYNPKVSVHGSGLTTEPREVADTLAVNVTGAVAAVQATLADLARERGCVILTGGGFKDEPDINRFALSIGKAGLHGVARAMLQPLQRRGIRLKTVVIDGFVRAGGQIDPDDLADFYWRVYTSPRRSVFRIGPKPGGEQLSLEL